MTTEANTSTRREVLAGAAVAALVGTAPTLTTPALARGISGAVNISATGELIRAVRNSIEGATFALEEIRSRAWASVTFRGSRHELIFRLDGPDAHEAAERFAVDLEASAFPLRGHILADIAVIEQEQEAGRARLRIEALTVEDQ